MPLIGGSNSLRDVPKGTPIEGFDTVGSPWPAGLPSDVYWTGTGTAGYPGDSWGVVGYGGYVGVGSYHQGAAGRVVCVP